MTDAERLNLEANLSAAFDAAIHGTGGVWPDWVYEAREAVRRQNENPPHFLKELCVILGWQGGTIHQALQAVRRLVESDKEEERLREIQNRLAESIR